MANDPHIGWVLAINPYVRKAVKAAEGVAAIAAMDLLRLGTALGTNHSIAGPSRSPIAARIGYSRCT